MADNTITALRKVQWGFEGTAASNTLTLDTQPTATDTFTIGATVYEVVASGAVAASYQINRGADLAAFKTNFLQAVNGTGGGYIANTYVSASAFTGDVTTLTARSAGTEGNSIATTETFTAGTNVFSGTTLAGGAGGHGTAVAATSIIAVEKMEFGDEYDKLTQPQFATGILAANTGATTPVQRGATWSFSDQPLPWEQYPHLLSLAVHGGVTPVYTSSIYRWTHTRTPTAHPNLDSITLERFFSDGGGNTIEQRAAYAMCESWGLKYAQGDSLKWSAKGFGRPWATNTATTSLSLPTPVLGVSALMKVYVDSTWGAIGGTQLTEQVIGCDLQVGTGLYPLWTAEGRSTLDFTKHMYDASKVTLSLNLMCLVQPSTYSAENTAAAAGTTRAIQLYISGSSSRVLKLNMLMRHTKPFYSKIDTQDGQDVVQFTLVGAPDTSNFFQAILDHPTVYTKA